MDRIELFLIEIVLALAVNLLANLIYKHLQERAKRESQFCSDDLANPLGLIEKLKDSKNSISRYLWPRFPSNARRLIKNYDASAPPSMSLKQSLIEALNASLDDYYLFNAERFSHATLRKETQKLARSTRDDTLRYRNRLLIEDAYPQEIVKRVKRYLSFDVRIAAAIISVFILVLAIGKGNTTATASLPTYDVKTTAAKSEAGTRKEADVPFSASMKEAEDLLVGIIHQQQEKHVQASTGLWAQNNFTDEDLKRFIEENRIKQIVDDLASDEDYAAVVEKIGSLSSKEREAVLHRGELTYKQTWSQLKLDPKTAPPEKLAEGQTEAGQQAEKMVAEAIVDSSRSRLKMRKL